MHRSPEDRELFGLPESQEHIKGPDILDQVEKVATRFAEAAAANLELEKELILENGFRDRLISVTATKLIDFIGRTAESLENLDQAMGPDKETLLRHIESTFSAYAQDTMELCYKVLEVHGRLEVDPLTGLPNRGAYERSLRRAVATNIRSGDAFSYVILDLDHFKRINDTHGHGAGDKVLQEFARRLSEDIRLREIDTIARYGGEEFVAVLPSTGKKGAAILSQRISEQMKRPFTITDNAGTIHEISVSASIGISEYKGWEEDPDGEGAKRDADASLLVLKGNTPDQNGVIQDRRGGIACEGRVLSAEEIESYHLEFVGTNGRVSSRPPGSTSYPPRKP